MKVEELIARLRKLDPRLDVLCYCEDEEILPMSHGFRIFDIAAVDVTDAETTRTKDGVPSLKLGKSEHSSSHALIEITADF